MSKPSYTQGWFKMPREWAFSGELTPNEKVVLMVILAHCNAIRDEDFHCWVGNKRMATESGICFRTVQYAVASLEEKKYLKVERGAHSRRIQILKVAEGADPKEAGVVRQRSKKVK